MIDKPKDRSDAALRERLDLAEKAAQGPWRMKMDSPELKPCPHCGDTDLNECTSLSGERSFISCLK